MLYIKEIDGLYFLPNESNIINSAININSCNKGIIYFLINDNSVVYVGKSKNGLKRIFDNHKDFDSISYIEVDISILDVIETLYIKKFQPVLNKNAGNCSDFKLLRNFRIESELI